MADELVTVMYHYVREISGSDYPEIKGLEFEGFKRQLDYLTQHYEIISAEHLMAYFLGDISTLPKNACMLTFDDGYRDHFKYVLPELQRRGLPGCFFPPARPVLDGALLDVNAIHFVLARCPDKRALLADVKLECSRCGIDEDDWSDLWVANGKPSRYDRAEVNFLKIILQRELPEEIRWRVIKSLFERYVGKSEEDFCDELYMSFDEVQSLISDGMYVGSHTYNHEWLNSLSPERQEIEIDLSIKFLEDLGAGTSKWIMCYPYGAYNEDTLKILQRKNCVVGFALNDEYSSLDKSKALEMSRLDTNEFPQ